MSSSEEMKRVITHAADQLHLAIEVEAKQHHRGQTIAAMALAEGMLLLLTSYLEISDTSNAGRARDNRGRFARRDDSDGEQRG